MPVNPTNIATLTTIMKITTRGGNVYGYTTLDMDISIGGVLYQGIKAIEPTAAENKNTLSSDNIEIKLLVSDNGISHQQIALGLFDDADVIISVIDFITLPSSIEQGDILVQGKVGRIYYSGDNYTFEIRTLSDLLARPIHNTLSPTCGYRLGDSKCTVDLLAQGGIVNTTVVNHVPANNTLTLAQVVTGVHATRLVGGTVKITSGQFNGFELRITVVSSPSIAYSGALPGNIPSGTTVQLRVACGKTIQECTAFNNADNFGGMLTGGRWIPSLSGVIRLG